MDSRRRYLTDDPTALKFVSWLRAVDQGDVAAMVEITDEMEAKDAHLQGVANTRRRALTALEWDIVDCPEAENQVLATKATEFVRQELRNLHTWETTLEHLATAIGPNVAAVELVWKESLLVETVDIPGHRLRGSTQVRGVLVATTEHPTGAPMPLGKFVVYHPNSRAGSPFNVTITRAQAWCYLIKHFVTADWAAFSEIFGMPVRVALLSKEVTPEEKTEAENMLKNMSSDMWGLFSDAVDFKFMEAGRGTQPYQPIIEWLEKKQSILYLGQTLSTEVGSVGSFAAAKVHDNVRADLLISDIQNEARVIRDKIFRPMLSLRFPGQDVPVPYFRRVLVEGRNIESEKLSLEQLRFAKEIGLALDRNTVYEKLSIPKPDQGSEDIIDWSKGLAQEAEPVAGDNGSGFKRRFQLPEGGG